MCSSSSSDNFDINEAVKRVCNEVSPVVHLCLSDVSDGHTKDTASGRSLNAEGREYLLMIVSDAFQGMPTIARHRRVQSCFQDGFDSGIVHSMQLRTWTVQQWIKKACPKSVREACPCTHSVSGNADGPKATEAAQSIVTEQVASQEAITLITEPLDIVVDGGSKI